MAENYHEKTVYVANARTGKVDRWKCIGEFTSCVNGQVKEGVCYLRKGSRYVSLPKRCCFDTEEAALAVLKKRK